MCMCKNISTVLYFPCKLLCFLVTSVLEHKLYNLTLRLPYSGKIWRALTLAKRPKNSYCQIFNLAKLSQKFCTSSAKCLAWVRAHRVLMEEWLLTWRRANPWDSLAWPDFRVARIVRPRQTTPETLLAVVSCSQTHCVRASLAGYERLFS